VYQVQLVVEHVVGLVRSGQQQQAEQMVDEVRRLGLIIDLSRQHWHSTDGRSGSTQPFSLTRAPAESSSSATAAAPSPANGIGAERALPLANLTDDKIKVVVQHVVGLVRSNQRAQADQIIEEVQRLGLVVDLQRQRWHSTDGRGGTMDPFHCQRLVQPAASAESNGAAAEEDVTAAVTLSDDRIKVVVEHVASLSRSNQQQQAAQIGDEVRRLGLTIDLAQRRWHTTDGRSGTMDPFSFSTSHPASTTRRNDSCQSYGAGAAAQPYDAAAYPADELAEGPDDGDDVSGGDALPPPRTSRSAAVSLATVMREQQQGKVYINVCVYIYTYIYIYRRGRRARRPCLSRL